MPKKKTKVSGEPLYYSGNIPEVTIQGNTPLKRIRRGYLDDMYDVVPNDAIRSRNLGVAPGQSKRYLESQAAARAIAARSNEYPIFADGELVGFSPSYREALAQNDRPLSPADPVGEFIVSGAALGKPLQAIGRGAHWVLGKAGNQLARNKIIGRTFNNSKINIPIKKSSFNDDVVIQEMRNPENSGYLIHYDNGDKLSAFGYHKPAHVVNGKLYPSPSIKPNESPYIWFNKDIPYGSFKPGDSLYPGRRYIKIKDNGKFTKHPTHNFHKEVVTTEPIDLTNATVLDYMSIPKVWGRNKYITNTEPIFNNSKNFNSNTSLKFLEYPRTSNKSIVKRTKKRNGGYIRRLESGGRLSY